jgi:hypothetical protein
MAEQAQQKCSDKDSTGIKTFHTQGAPQRQQPSIRVRRIPDLAF